MSEIWDPGTWARGKLPGETEARRVHDHRGTWGQGNIHSYSCIAPTANKPDVNSAQQTPLEVILQPTPPRRVRALGEEPCVLSSTQGGPRGTGLRGSQPLAASRTVAGPSAPGQWAAGHRKQTYGQSTRAGAHGGDTEAHMASSLLPVGSWLG